MHLMPMGFMTFFIRKFRQIKVYVGTESIYAPCCWQIKINCNSLLWLDQCQSMICPWSLSERPGKAIWTFNSHRSRWLLACMIICISVMGCQNTTPPVSFYALTPMITSDVLPDGQQTLKDVTIGIGPILFPRTLQRPQIVTRPSPNRLELSEFHRWGGDLKQDFLNILVQNISMIMGSNQVFKYPWSPSFEPKYRLTLDVNQFDGRLGESVLLNSIWEIKQGKPGKERTEIKRSIIEQPVSGDDYNALVEAKSKALKTLSIEITDKIRVQEK